VYLETKTKQRNTKKKRVRERKSSFKTNKTQQHNNKLLLLKTAQNLLQGAHQAHSLIIFPFKRDPKWRKQKTKQTEESIEKERERERERNAKRDMY
jgi:hypothetical protein